ncbi:hypothetical protein [Lacibacter sediminis]|uniref:Lipoprotein n=1 Tax=Lacibacter sediminis TaxID=2760713 RepID=A0A7G5XEI5_9BACT|nr:hypothetical protein [Lacibacter sediminis]QNA43888.1 hypothetical protein H4075_17700 [Lacibacter sediminis]
MKIGNIIAGILVVASFASCTINEEIDLSTAGKGQYIMAADMSQALEMMKSMGGGQVPDSIKDKSIDTTMSLASQLDSLDKPLSAEDQAYFKNGTLHMVMSMNDNKFNMETKYPVKDIKDLQKFFKAYYYVDSVNKSKKKTPQPGEEAPEEGAPGAGMGGLANVMGNMPSTASPYIITDTSIQRIALTKESMTETYGDQMKGAEMFLGQMVMSVTIKLPRPVKRLEGKSAKLLDDKKTVFFTASMAEMMEDPENGSFLIVF